MNSLYLTQFITVALVHFLAVASPGPDFLLVTKNSLKSGRGAGILTALGVALGIGVHVTYSIIGVGYIISKSIILFNTIKYAGALYLIYIGIKGLKSRKKAIEENIIEAEVSEKISPFKNIRIGFLVNVLNPKATIFFVAVFTQVINPGTPKIIELLYGTEMIVATFVWFSIVAIAFSHSKLKSKINSMSHWIDRTAGAILIALGIKVALSEK